MSVPTFHFALREDLKDHKQFLPSQAFDTDTGYDVRAAMPDRKSLTIYPFEHVKVPLGIRGFCPPGYWYQLKPRSSSFTKKYLHFLYGTVDQTYEGELVAAFQYIPNFNMTDFIHTQYDKDLAVLFGKSFYTKTYTLEWGEAIGQIIPTKREVVQLDEITNDQLDEMYKQRAATRKAGGFGSTG